jgi:F-type H+-transporting ATPase subunit delta
VREETVARSYAATLLALAERHEGMDAFGSAASLVSDLLEDNPDFGLFLETPRIDAAAKKAALERVFEGQAPPSFLHFLQVVLDKRRQGLLGAIAYEYKNLVDERMGRIHAEVTVARAMDADARAQLESELGPVLGGTVVTRERVDPEILGGIVVRSGDQVWDGSIRRRLEGMRRSLLRVDLPEGRGDAPVPAGVAD